jgi:hypothetical protein
MQPYEPLSATLCGHHNYLDGHSMQIPLNIPAGKWQTGENASSARGHAICVGAHVIAKVYGNGYPTGRGWAPVSQATANFIVEAGNVANETCCTPTELVEQRNELLAALRAFMALFEGPMDTGFIIAPATRRKMTYGEQKRIDDVITLAMAAVQRVEEPTPRKAPA